MRRSRHKLEVSTFPFLAVLLCAMGSLIFLLMVMDKRAKIVREHQLEAKRQADAEAREARAAAQANSTAEREADRAGKFALAAADRQAAWEKERDNLHRMLLEQERELRSQLEGMAREVDTISKNVEKKQGYIEAVKGYLTKENARLLREYQELARRKNEAGLKDQQGTANRGELQQLTLDLLKMKQTLKELKELKSRPSDTFSLIPYGGKFGDTRRPIYVECAALGMTLFPNRTFLSGLTMRDEDFRREIRERAGTLEFQQKTDVTLRGLPPTNANAYVMFLVRPDGIRTYNLAKRALDRYGIDFGYELVDANWVFDFSNEDLASKQPWQDDNQGPLRNRPVPAGGLASLSPGGTAFPGAPRGFSGASIPGGVPQGNLSGPGGSSWVAPGSNSGPGVPGGGPPGNISGPGSPVGLFQGNSAGPGAPSGPGLPPNFSGSNAPGGIRLPASPSASGVPGGLPGSFSGQGVPGGPGKSLVAGRSGRRCSRELSGLRRSGRRRSREYFGPESGSTRQRRWQTTRIGCRRFLRIRPWRRRHGNRWADGRLRRRSAAELLSQLDAGAGRRRDDPGPDRRGWIGSIRLEPAQCGPHGFHRAKPGFKQFQGWTIGTSQRWAVGRRAAFQFGSRPDEPIRPGRIRRTAFWRRRRIRVCRRWPRGSR